MKSRIITFLLLLVASFHCNQNPEVKINIWYGLEQSFGHIGNTQRQINILGNVQSDLQRINAYFTMNNDSTKQYLTLGNDLHRLAKPGDFNIEIERDNLLIGKNIIKLLIESNNTILTSEIISINYLDNQPETTYKLKHRVESLSNNRTLYSAKFWLAKNEEPEFWDFQAIENSPLRETGSACLIAHNTDVTFGDVYVRPIPSKQKNESEIKK